MTKNQVYAIFKTPTRTAEALGIAQPSVSGWPDDEIPKRREYEIERLMLRWTQGLQNVSKIFFGL